MAVLFSTSIGFAQANEYVCEPIPIFITPTVQSQYVYNQMITIQVNINGVPQGYTVSGEIRDSNGNVVQTISFGTWVSSDIVQFGFNAITRPDTYTFRAFLTRPVPPSDTVFSDAFNFIIKAPLSVQFTIDDIIQYTNQDVKFTLIETTPSGEIVQTNKILTIRINGAIVNVNEQFLDQGSGRWQIIIPSGILNPGIMDVQLDVEDFAGKYEKVVANINGISITRPTVSVTIDAPSVAKVGDTDTIRILTRNIFGQADDVDTIMLTVSYPDGITTKIWRKQGTTSDFSNPTLGVYEIRFNFADSGGGTYRWEVVATKAGLNSGSDSDRPVTVVSGGGIDPTCDLTTECDGNCPDDPDCQETPISPIFIGIGALIVIVIGFTLWNRFVKKK